MHLKERKEFKWVELQKKKKKELERKEKRRKENKNRKTYLFKDIKKESKKIYKANLKMK